MSNGWIFIQAGFQENKKVFGFVGHNQLEVEFIVNSL